VPEWIVCSAGTGGTSATLGRYVRYRGHSTRILCADPEFSAFYDHYAGTGPSADPLPGSRIEGIGRPQVELSFITGCIDAMVKVPDALSLAAMRQVNRQLGRKVGGSTGTNFVGVLHAAQMMRARDQRGSIVAILCDQGERYAHSYYNPEWYQQQGIDIDAADAVIAGALSGGNLPEMPVAGSL